MKIENVFQNSFCYFPGTEVDHKQSSIKHANMDIGT